MSTDNEHTPKWTEIELLPEWDETFYDVYTAKKFGKWLMLKTLKPQYRDVAEYQQMIEKEFDVRYNLAHPNIVMINDYEEVPGIGMCIITDDVYGDSLAKLIAQKKVDDKTLEKITTSLVDALDYIQRNHIVHHPIRPETIIFTENIGNLKLIDVGFDQLDHLSHDDTSRDIYNFGQVLRQVLDALPTRHANLEKVAERCLNDDPRHRYHDIQDLKMALGNSSNNRLYITIIIFLTIMIALLGWLVANPSSSTVQ
jgi:hypothetical protein